MSRVFQKLFRLHIVASCRCCLLMLKVGIHQYMALICYLSVIFFQVLQLPTSYVQDFSYCCCLCLMLCFDNCLEFLTEYKQPQVPFCQRINLLYLFFLKRLGNFLCASIYSSRRHSNVQKKDELMLLACVSSQSTFLSLFELLHDVSELQQSYVFF